MAKIIAAMNMTLDGYCDHTVMTADDEIHQHYNDLLSRSGALVYGRVTYQLMESYWPDVVKNPTGNQPMDDFAVLIDDLPKLVFSHTLQQVSWKHARLAKNDLQTELQMLRQQPGRDVLIGSPGLIAAALNMDFVDELQISVQPIVAGKGLTLFKNINAPIHLELLRTKQFTSSGSVLMYFEPARKG